MNHITRYYAQQTKKDDKNDLINQKNTIFKLVYLAVEVIFINASFSRTKISFMLGRHCFMKKFNIIKI